MAQPYYDQQGNLFVWTGSGYQKIPTIAQGDAGQYRTPGMQFLGGFGDSGDYTSQQGSGAEDMFGITDPNKYGLNFDPSSWMQIKNQGGSTNDPNAFSYQLKSGDKQGSMIDYTLDPATGQYRPNLRGDTYWDTNTNKQAWKAAIPFAAMGAAMAAPALLGGEAAAAGGGGLTELGTGAVPALTSASTIAEPGAAIAGGVGGGGAIPGMNAGGGWGLTDLGTAAGGSGGGIGSTVGNTSLSQMMQGGLGSSLPSAGGSSMGWTDYLSQIGSLFGGGGSGGGFNWGNAIGGLLGAVGGAKAGGDQTDTRSNTPPPWYTNQWQNFANWSNKAAEQPFTPYGGQRVADFNPDQMQAFERIRNGVNGTPEAQAGSKAIQGMLGPYQENPYLQGMIDKTQKDMSAGLGAAGLGSGSFGNAGVAQQGANAMADASLGVRYGDYNNYMNRQIPAAGLARQYGMDSLERNNALLQAGGIQQQNAQQRLDVPYQDYLTQQNWPLRQLGMIGAPLGYSNVGNTQSSTQQGNPWMSGAGGAILGAQLGGGYASTNPYRGININRGDGQVAGNYPGSIDYSNIFGGTKLGGGY
jgi:hypothetical protein